MTIDGRSLLAVVAALCVVFSLVVLALERRIRQPMPGLRLWAFSNLFLGVAAGAHMLQGHVPLWVPAIVGNWTMLIGRSTSVAALRQSYDMLLLKVLAVLQDNDPSLARAIAGSREAIWGILADREKFNAII